MDADNLYIRFDDLKIILDNIKENIKPVVSIDPSALLSLSSHNGFKERIVLKVPFDISRDTILQNIAALVLRKFVHYYFNSDIRSSHHGISIKALEGFSNSALFKETEFILEQLSTRNDIAGSVIKNVSVNISETSERTEKTYIVNSIKKVLDIKIGCRIFYSQRSLSSQHCFIPIQAGEQIVNQLYCNIESILLHNYVHYDEINHGYLNLTSTLLYKDIGQILKRAKTKINTRKKVLANLSPYLTNDGIKSVEDSFYDRFSTLLENKVNGKITRSENLYQSYLHSKAKEYSTVLNQQAIETLAMNNQGEEESASKDIAAYVINMLNLQPEGIESLPILGAEKNDILMDEDKEENAEIIADFGPFKSMGKIEFNMSYARTVISSKSFSNSNYQSTKRTYAAHPLKSVSVRGIPIGEIVLQSAESNVRIRGYSLHPLKRQFLLYPFRSDFEKLFKSMEFDNKRQHPEVSDFNRRLFARRTHVPHPFDPNPPKNLGRRHYDNKNTAD